MALVETVKVKDRDGYVIINRADFVKGKHVEFVEKPADPAPAGKK